jgi:hypothetical protein
MRVSKRLKFSLTGVALAGAVAVTGCSAHAVTGTHPSPGANSSSPASAHHHGSPGTVDGNNDAQGGMGAASSAPPSAPTLVSVTTTYLPPGAGGIAHVYWTNHWSDGITTGATWVYFASNGQTYTTGDYVAGDNLPAEAP